MTELSPSAREAAERYSPEIKAKVNEAAKEIAGYANECCYRSDGFESHIEELASDAIYEVLAGYQARDAEAKLSDPTRSAIPAEVERVKRLRNPGKEWAPWEIGNFVHEMMELGMVFVEARDSKGKGEAVTIFGPVDTAPPAPKDERVEKLISKAIEALQAEINVAKHHGENPWRSEEVLKELRAFEGGER